MGSKNGDDPDEILMQNHQMLASVHSGRSVFQQVHAFISSFKSKPLLDLYFGFACLSLIYINGVEQHRASSRISHLQLQTWFQSLCSQVD